MSILDNEGHDPAGLGNRSSQGDVQRMTDGYNIMRDALAWYSSHSVEAKLGHLPQWVVMARELLARPWQV